MCQNTDNLFFILQERFIFFKYSETDFFQWSKTFFSLRCACTPGYKLVDAKSPVEQLLSRAFHVFPNVLSRCIFH